jgi:hypothetical protein
LVALLAISAVQPAANDAHAADCVSLLQPGRSEKEEGVNVADVAAAGVVGGARGRSGDVAQAQTSTLSVTAHRERRCIAMIWFVVEALVALLLAVFIVWFTTGGTRRNSVSVPPRTAAPPSGSPPGKDAD